MYLFTYLFIFTRIKQIMNVLVLAIHCQLLVFVTQLHYVCYFPLASPTTVDINSYYLTTPNDPAVFFEENPSCSLASDQFQDKVVCAGQQQVLTDKSTGAGLPLDPSEYVGWDSTGNALDGFTMIINANYTILTRLDIHFYNHPAAGIGLPEVTSIYVSSSSQANGVFEGPMSFVYASNDDLAQSDNGMRMLSIIITESNVGFYRFVRINFDYSSPLIWRTQLTEIRGYGGTGK